MKISTRVALAACVALGAVVPASANHSWGKYHWARSGSTLELKVNTAITSGWDGYVSTAINSDWDGRSVLSLTEQDAPAATSRKRCSPITGQVLVCNDAYGQRGWLGIATIWADSSGHITAGTTKLNDTYFAMARYSSPAWHRFVACQEIGHDFGLAHQNEIFTNANTGSCMDYTNAPQGGTLNGFNYGPSNEHPNSHDTDQLNSIYAGTNHPDSYSTSTAATDFGVREVGKAAPRALPDPGNTFADWGASVDRDEKGRPHIFVRQLPGGGAMITHVLWAPDAKGTEAH
jgi:hypothetical protein